MQIASGISTLQMTIDGNRNPSADQEMFRAKIRKAKKIDWDRVIVRIDTYIARAGAVALALSALYFAPILISIALK